MIAIILLLIITIGTYGMARRTNVDSHTKKKLHQIQTSFPHYSDLGLTT